MRAPSLLPPRGGGLSPEGFRDWSLAFERPLGRSFYARPTARVARDLLGCRLVRRPSRGDGAWRVGRIVETEAYVAGDPANHASRGKTERNRSMFLGPGHVYVYRIHQVHCANLTTARGQAVLLRALEPLTPLLAEPRGPGLLCRAFGLDRVHDGLDAVEGELRVLPREGPPVTVARVPRVGIRLAADRPLRFLDARSEWVSRRPASLRGKARG